MIFGIKTKKDRKIEELKEENALLHERLKTMLSETHIIHEPVELKPIISRYVVSRLHSIPASFIRRSLSHQLADYLDHDDDVKVIYEMLPDGNIAYSMEINIVKGCNNDIYRN